MPKLKLYVVELTDARGNPVESRQLMTNGGKLWEVCCYWNPNTAANEANIRRDEHGDTRLKNYRIIELEEKN